MFRDTAISLIKTVRSIYPKAQDDREAFAWAMKDLLVKYSEYQEIRHEVTMFDSYGGDNNFHFVE